MKEWEATELLGVSQQRVGNLFNDGRINPA